MHLAGIDFSAAAPDVARALIGTTLWIDGVGGLIAETEAYDADDPASHSFNGPTSRNAAMFGEPGRAYVYRTYGLHWCLNFVCGPAGHGAAVLIRAIVPQRGLETMRERRGLQDAHLLCAGPGRLCQALAVDGGLNGLRLDAPPFELRVAEQPHPIGIGTRIGISKAVTVPWRFGLAGSRYLSRPLR
ncbi:DNA-3-methyladenine glycosylase [Aquabacterium olei]|uniref:Putative 3-methyladenine DNA glycosylase n=1 Tax=Aquabacterium olei TaxID=1296669 RepID=A0A2U8FTN0_9BURK|nr:DNA-3-methyladenine glycosylase [Aquabacterium olei]AWI54168.1 DNA-3-methyladenine glycosylase [Aquabacterium olei]